jgi:hypothetical protein
MLHTSAILPAEAQPMNGVGTQPASPPDDISAELMRITPEVARDLLKNALPNRPISKARVRALIEDLRRGRWQTNGESIILDASLRLLDGQHRLMAVAESGIAITALVVVGVAPAAMPSIDQGRSKGGADVLHMAQLPRAQQLASAARWLWRYQNQSMRQATVLLRDYELPAFIGQHPGLPGALDWGRTVRAFLAQGSASMLFHVMAQTDAATARQLFHGLATGQNLSAADPPWHVRERLLKDKRPLRHAVIVERAALVVLAWDCVRKGLPWVPGRTWKGVQDKSVPFPWIV